MRFPCWVWGFCTSIWGGTCPAAVGGAGRGGGTPGARSCALGGCSRPPLRRLTGFQSELRNPGLPCRPRGRLCPGLAPPKAARGRQGGSVQLPHLPHGPACHTRTLPSAIGLGQLCPPEIITSFLLLLLLLLLLQSPSQRHLPPLTAQLCTLGAPKLRLHSWSHRPHFQCLLLLLLVLPFGLGLARGGGGSLAPGFGSWCSWKEQLCSQPSSDQHLSPGAAVPHPLCPRGSPCSQDWGFLSPSCTITCGLSHPDCWHRAGAPNVSSGGAPGRPSPPTRPRAVAVEQLCPHTLFPQAEPPLGADHGF